MEIACCSSSSLSASLLSRRNHSSLRFNPCFSIAPSRLTAAPLVSSVRPRRRRAAGGLKCKCLFGLGVPELAVIAGVAALVFGPKKLPEIGRSLGKTIKSFQQAAKEFESEVTKTSPENETTPPPEKVQEVANGEEKKELEASSAKENV